jgi:gliding motility-associated-like protein
MKKNILLIIIVTILQSFTTFAQTQVYNLGSSNLTTAMNSCGTAIYKTGNWGFQWNSTGSLIPTSVTVELDFGLSCSGITTQSGVTLNGVNQVPQPISINASCLCSPPLGNSVVTWTLNPNDYVVGGSNQITINSSSPQGVNALQAYANTYARVTVVYGPNKEMSIKNGSSTILSGDTTPVTGDGTEYGSLAAGTSLDRTFTIENQGTLDLLLTDTPIVSISGSAAFSVQTQAASNTIAGLGSETFVVRFNPTCAQTGLQTAVISIANDDDDENPYTFTVQGTTGGDTVNPVAIAKNITVQLDVNGNVTVNAADLNDNSTDNCGINNYTIAPEISGTVCNIVGENGNLQLDAPSGAAFTSILFASYGTPTGSCGNFATGSCHATNSVSVVSPYIIGNSSVSIPASNGLFGDPCGGTPKNLAIEASYGPAAGSATTSITYSCTDIGAHNVVLFVTDNSGNVSTVNATITVEDKIAATVLTKDITVQLDATGNATIVVADVDNGSSDACGTPTLVVSPDTFTCTNVGPNTVTLTATDVNGNISSQTAIVTIEDKIAATVLTKDITVQLDAAGNATIVAADVDNGSSDICGTPTLVVSPDTFTCANVGPNTVTLTATDANGNISSATAVVTIEDKIAATVLTKDITVQLDATGSATIVVADVDNGSSDACGTPTLVVSPDTFTCANVGNNTVTLTATDANGNISSATAVVTIEDKIAATVLTKDITVQLDATGNATIVAADIDNGSSDICGTPTLVVSPDTFTCVNVGNNTVTLAATDANGNISSQTAIVTIEDKIAATVLTKDITVQLDTTGNASIVAADVDNGSTDICGTPTLIVSPASFTCANVGANTVTLTATDVNGNVSSQTAIVTIENKIVPTVLTKNITIQLNTTGNAAIIASDIDNGSTVACGTPTLVVSPATFTCANVGSNVVTLTVTDANGNVSSKTATVTVQDKIGATVFTKNLIVQLDASGNAAITANQIDNGSSDVCGINSMTVTPNTFNCNNTGINTVTLTVKDVNGNITTGTATVTVQEKILPIPKTQNITVELDDAGNASITANDINNGSSDNCGIASYSLNKTSFNCTNLGANTVVLTVTDKSGNTATANATVTVKSTAGDNDNDGILDNCDPDDDNDGILDTVDNCPITANPYQEDRNHNGLGDACDEDQMNISEAFTPNGDGINDTWVISNIENYSSSVVRVFNRWGAEVFVARNYQNDWDGHAKGNSSSLPAASSYYYQIDLDGNGSIDKQGWIYINR